MGCDRPSGSMTIITADTFSLYSSARPSSLRLVQYAARERTQNTCPTTRPKINLPGYSSLPSGFRTFLPLSTKRSFIGQSHVCAAKGLEGELHFGSDQSNSTAAPMLFDCGKKTSHQKMGGELRRCSVRSVNAYSILKLMLA